MPPAGAAPLPRPAPGLLQVRPPPGTGALSCPPICPAARRLLAAAILADPLIVYLEEGPYLHPVLRAECELDAWMGIVAA